MMEPLTKDDYSLFEQLGIESHFPPSLTDGKWRYKIDEDDNPVFELRFKEIKNLEWLQLDQLAEDLNFTAGNDTAYFVTEYDGFLPKLMIGFIDKKKFEEMLPAMQETVRSRGEHIKSTIESWSRSGDKRSY